MPRNLTNPLHVARLVLSTDRAWLLFVEIARKAQAGTFYRLVNSARHLNADGKFWQAASLAIELPSEEADGSLSPVSLTLQDVSRLAAGLVEVDGELIGASLTVYVQHESSLASFDPALKWTQTITAVEADERSVRATCQHPAQIARVPARVYTRKDFPQLLPVGRFA